MFEKLRPRTRFFSVLLTLAVLLAGLPEASARRGGGDDDGGGGGGNDDDALTLRVNDAIAKPGGIVAIVLRTYAARPIRQGQISVRVRGGRPAAAASNSLSGPTLEDLTAPAQPLRFLSAVVYSTQSDSATTAAPAGAAGNQAVHVRFASPSGTVNASDGPLAVLRFRLHPGVTPGQQFTIEVDPALSSLVDSGGQPIVIEPRNATLTVRGATAPFAVEAEGDEVEPGETAELGFQTFEPFKIASGRVTLRYNAAVGGRPAVRMDPRYGKATFTVTRRPGVLVVDFKSPDRTLNDVPGTIVAVDLPTKATATVGTESPVRLDPAGTWLKNAQGQRLKLKIENGVLAFEED